MQLNPDHGEDATQNWVTFKQKWDGAITKIQLEVPQPDWFDHLTASERAERIQNRQANYSG